VIQTLLSAYLGEAGLIPLTVSSAEEGLAILEQTPVDIALVDIRLGGMSVVEMLGEIKRISPTTDVVIMTSHASTETAIEAIRKGAYDYLTKPFDDLDMVEMTLARVIENRRLTQKNDQLLKDLERRNDELSRTVGRLSSLIDAGRAMSVTTTLPELLDHFVEFVSRELGAERVSLMLLDRGTEELHIAASRGISTDIVHNTRVKLGQGIAGHVATTGEPFLVNDVWTHPVTRDSADPLLSDSFVSLPIILSMPIKLQKSVLGVINVTNRRTAGAFSKDDMEFLYGLAGQAAVAVENAWRFTEMQAAFESLRESQAQLVVSERLNALGEMAAGVAHDVNNVLGGLLGKTELILRLLERGQYNTENLKADLSTIQRCALQGAETIRRIQSFTRIRQDLPSELLDLNEAVHEAVDVTRHKWKNEQEARGIAIRI
jgi:DNA-binding response OmpR family regulator/putative methionine-R-sulfoxide reductase with GAF domain